MAKCSRSYREGGWGIVQNVQYWLREKKNYRKYIPSPHPLLAWLHPAAAFKCFLKKKKEKKKKQASCKPETVIGLQVIACQT